IKQHEVAPQAPLAVPARPTLADAARIKAGTKSPGIAIASIHDFVSEMVAGTWLAFQSERGYVSARLVWTGALRMTYVFASRSGLSVFVYSPEDLGPAVVSGQLSLVVEPVRLFERAVSSALNMLAAGPAGGSSDRAIPAGG